jgi:CDP-glucose 4,6-dehydratase
MGMNPGLDNGRMRLERFYRDKRVLITGHTGFKGSWLGFWLEKMGSEIAGFAIDVPTSPSNYEILALGDKIKNYQGDIRDLSAVRAAVIDFSPEIVFHLAAQPIVRVSYDEPVDTISTNALGTLHILECIRRVPSIEVGVIITSDKCYHNQEWPWGYRESDRLGGRDPYSASKGCAELIAYTYCRSFFGDLKKRVATTRAGNVIGGGDWAQDRIVPDCIRAWTKNEILAIRSPAATRPWQHVLEPLSGYLWLAMNLWENNPKAVGQSFNFGPADSEVKPVGDLVSEMARYWKDVRWQSVQNASDAKHEHSLLKLCCDKALHHLNWQPILDFEKTVRYTSEWYRIFHEGSDADMAEVTRRQIKDYCDRARRQNIAWAVTA